MNEPHTSILYDIVPGVDLEITTVRSGCGVEPILVEYVHLRVNRKDLDLPRYELVWDINSEVTPFEAWAWWLDKHDEKRKEKEEVDEIQRSIRHRKLVDSQSIAENDPHPIRAFSRYPSIAPEEDARFNVDAPPYPPRRQEPRQWREWLEKWLHG